MSFDKLGLEAELLRAVRSEGYDEPTPIQAQSIPVILEGRDVLGGAQTGTGKTAAFTLPMLQILNGREAKSRAPRALILTPTRELAAQIQESIRTYGKNIRLRSTVVFGGVGIHPQIDKLRRGVDILVATPGRLLDHAERGTVNLAQIEILVLDEADRMLDMGFIHDIKRVLKLLPANRQNLLFSATYSDEIKRLSDGLLHNPVMIEVARRNTATELTEQVIHPVGRTRKRALLSHLIKEDEWTQVLVFTRTKHGANRLAKQLATDGIDSTAIHGNKSQSARTKALADFKAGRVRVLVATDIAARGLDIDSLPHVVNFELPNVAEDYVHRIGRTGRAGLNGTAVSLVCTAERPFLRDIERLIKKTIRVEEIEGFHQDTDAEHKVNMRDDAEEKRRQFAPKRGRSSRGGGRSGPGGGEGFRKPAARSKRSGGGGQRSGSSRGR